MILPAIWNEKEVGLGFTRYQNSPTMLSSYVNGIVSRFVMGQDMQTVQARVAFLEQFNKFAEVSRESYKWQRYMNGGRAKLEEDAEDAKAEGVLRQAQADLEMSALDTDTRTGPLGADALKSLGLSGLAQSLSKQAGRPVNFMIYGSEDALKSRGAPYVPLK